MSEVDRNLEAFLGLVLEGRSKAYLLRIEEKLLKVGIRELRDLIPPLFARKRSQTINFMMNMAGEKKFTSPTLLAMREGVLLQDCALEAFLHWARPKWHGTDMNASLDKLEKIGATNVQTLCSMLLDENSLNSKLKHCGLRCFTLDSLKALRSRAARINRIIRTNIELNVYLISGQFLGVLPLKDSTTGLDMYEAILPCVQYLRPKAHIQGMLVERMPIYLHQNVAQLPLTTGMPLHVVVCEKFSDSLLGRFNNAADFNCCDDDLSE